MIHVTGGSVRTPIGPIALALSASAWETALVIALSALADPNQDSPVRRCVDVVDVLTGVGSGTVRSVVIDADFPQLDADVVARIVAGNVLVVGVCNNEAGDRRLRQWGIQRVVDVTVDDMNVTAERLAAVLAVTSSSGAALGVSQQPQPQLHAPFESIAPAPQPLSQPTNPVGRLVAVWGPPGAPGRSTIALGIAESAARAGHSALLVDGDTHAPGIAPMLGIADEASGLIAACRHADRATLDVETLARLARSIDNRWRVLTGLPHADRWPEVRASSTNALLRTARALCEVTVVDVGASLTRDEELLNDTLVPRRDAVALTAIEAADVVVAVGGCEPVALTRLLSGIGALRELNATAPLLVVVNRVRESALGPDGRKGLREFVAKASGAQSVKFVPYDRLAFDAAALRCRTVTEHAPGSKVVAALAGVVESVIPMATQCWDDRPSGHDQPNRDQIRRGAGSTAA